MFCSILFLKHGLINISYHKICRIESQCITLIHDIEELKLKWFSQLNLSKLIENKNPIQIKPK